jgi:predicted phosphate transport protein (TIGR00153 family)
MFGRFLPKNVSFFNYFEQLGRLSTETCQVLVTIAEHKISLSEGAARIKKLEHDADDVTHTCIEALHKTFITPFDRADIHSLIKRLDDIIDSVDSAVSRMELYEITEVRPEARELAEVLAKGSHEIENALRGLRDLHDIETINASCIRIYDFENQADALLRQALVRLFKEEDAITVIKWKEIYERLEKATDRCEAVANIIQGVVIEAS